MAREKKLNNGWPIVKDYRDADGTGYVIVRETSTNPVTTTYLWTYEEPDEERDVSETRYDTVAEALRAAAADWDINAGEWHSKRASKMRAVATRLEKKEQSDAR